MLSSSTAISSRIDADQREPLPGLRGDEERERNAERERDQLLAERGFGFARGTNPVPGMTVARSRRCKEARSASAAPLIYSPAAAGSGFALAARSALSNSASRKASSIACSALSRGSHSV